MTSLLEKNHVGIDVSKSFLDVIVLPEGKYIQVENNEKGLKKLSKFLSLYSDAHIVLEATGGYEKQAIKHLVNEGFKVSVVNPRQIRDFAKATGRLAKTDRIDAKVIALYAQKMTPEVRAKPSEMQESLAELQARRNQLIDMITMEKNRLDKANPRLKKSIQRVIKALEKELESIEDAIKELITKDSEYQNKQELLQTIKGVGEVTAFGLLATLPELGQLTAKQIAALAGLAPFNCDSGSLRGQRKIWGGRASVRRVLYMSTIVAIRFNEQIKAFYERLLRAGKKKMVALTACMRKLLVIMNAMIKNNESWQPI